MLLDHRGFEGPLHRRVYDALKAAIGNGRLAPGTRLPSTRTLAADLKLSRNTISLAYDQLVAEGYVVPRRRSMMCVASDIAFQPPAATEPKRKTEPRVSAQARRLMDDPAMPSPGSYRCAPGLRYDFRYGRPAIDDFPHEIWRKLVASRMRTAAPASFGYGAPGGSEPLREALSGYLSRARGLACSAQQIIIVDGSQQAFDLIARVLLDPGDTFVIEEPHYHGSRMAFEAAGAKAISVPVDAEGLDTTRLPPAEAGARLCCVTPCHQFPTGVIMPRGRRLALLEWASRTVSWVVEDDYVSEFRYEGNPIEALQRSDRAGRVIYVGTFSKIMFPSLRVAYMVLPPALLEPVLAAKWVADRYTTMLGQEALADFITTGQFERYLRRARTRNLSRRRTLIEALQKHFGGTCEIAGENAGVHLLVWLNNAKPRDVGAIIARAARVGVGVYPIAPYYTRAPRRAGLLFGYASLSEAEIRAGIRRLADVLHDAS
jgi:GntR family transcriptional regulator/MocR family aminotransferase